MQETDFMGRGPAIAVFDAEIPPSEQVALLSRFTKDLREAARNLNPSQMRWLVDMYYAVQQYRIAAAAQQRTQAEAEEPNEVVTYIAGVFGGLERQIQTAMRYYAERKIVGRWSLAVPGIGPVIASGLLAHIDIEKAPSAGHIWSYFGLNPEQKWLPKTKRPWNARGKVLAYYAGESFVKVQNRPNDVYGKIYVQRKEYEQGKNLRGEYADQAARILQEKKIGQDTIAYSFYAKGQLPPAHIHARARRYAAKLFLAHWQYVAWEVATGKPPANPYAIEHLGHTDVILPPFWPFEE